MYAHGQVKLALAGFLSARTSVLPPTGQSWSPNRSKIAQPVSTSSAVHRRQRSGVHTSIHDGWGLCETSLPAGWILVGLSALVRWLSVGIPTNTGSLTKLRDGRVAWLGKNEDPASRGDTSYIFKPVADKLPEYLPSRSQRRWKWKCRVQVTPAKEEQIPSLVHPGRAFGKVFIIHSNVWFFR